MSRLGALKSFWKRDNRSSSRDGVARGEDADGSTGLTDDSEPWDDVRAVMGAASGGTSLEDRVWRESRRALVDRVDRVGRTSGFVTEGGALTLACLLAVLLGVRPGS